MCLSSVYEMSGGDKNLVCEYVSNIQTLDGEVIMTDIVGAETKIRGEVTSIDLVKNIIIVEAKD